MAARLLGLGVVVREAATLVDGMAQETVDRQPVGLMVGLGNDHLHRHLSTCFDVAQQPLIVVNDLYHPRVGG